MCTDLVSALKAYIERTKDIRQTNVGKVSLFIQLTKPYEAISAAAVTKILTKAGLEGRGFFGKIVQSCGSLKVGGRRGLPEAAV